MRLKEESRRADVSARGPGTVSGDMALDNATKFEIIRLELKGVCASNTTRISPCKCPLLPSPLLHRTGGRFPH